MSKTTDNPFPNNLRSKAASIAAEHYLATTNECVVLTNQIVKLAKDVEEAYQEIIKCQQEVIKSLQAVNQTQNETIMKINGMPSRLPSSRLNGGGDE